jgi:hypothetical protein
VSGASMLPKSFLLPRPTSHSSPIRSRAVTSVLHDPHVTTRRTKPTVCMVLLIYEQACTVMPRQALGHVSCSRRVVEGQALSCADSA